MFWRERAEQYHTEGQCHMKQQYHITAVSLEGPRFKMCFTWSQTSSAVALLWSLSARARPQQGLALLDTAPISGCGMGEEGRSVLLGPGDAEHLSSPLQDS